MGNKIEIFKPAIKRIDLENVLNSMMKDSIAYGDFAKEFEERLTNRTNCRNILAINSYFNAIWLSLEALEINEGDEVILPSFCPQIYLNILKFMKVVPVLVDLEKENLKPSLEHIRKVISEKTKAVILFHYFGYIFDTAPYIEIFPNIIEDISSIVGFDSLNIGIKINTSIAIADFSIKGLITTGEGAAIFTPNKKIYSKIYSLLEIDYNMDLGYYPRLNCLMPDLNAAMGITQEKSLNHRLKLREQIGKIYEESVKKSKGVVLIQEDDQKHIYSDYAMIVKSSLKEAIKFFKKYDVETGRPFAFPLHHYMNLGKNDFPNTEDYYLHTLMVPIHSTLSKKDVELISKIILSMI